MELIIDTWNVLHQTGILPPESAGIGTRGLCTLIQRSRWAGERITLVCDGTPSDIGGVGPKLQTIFTGPHRTADDEIVDRVANSSSARSILVITSDREIIRSIKKNGAKHLGSAAFLQTLFDDASTSKKKRVHRPSGLSRAHANEWRKEFGLDEQAIQDNDNPMIKPDEPLLPDDLLDEAQRLINPSE
jgi:predicted RNA-binding protein with PIN domain